MEESGRAEDKRRVREEGDVAGTTGGCFFGEQHCGDGGLALR